jgi:Fic family protein
LAEYLRQWWAPQFDSPTKSDHMGGWYHPYAPDLLAGWDPPIPGSLAASIGQAEEAVRQLNRSDFPHPGLVGIGRFLLRAESVGSSAIEGLRVGPRRLLAAEERLARGRVATDSVAAEVLGNIAAMRRATNLATQRRHLTLDDMLDVHDLLMSRSPTPELGGVLREEQNWIGGGNFNPCNSDYVPPPPGRVPELMVDLIDYVNTDHHSPLTQAAIAHAQFETIHPFGDGNGRAGRALIHIVLQKRGLAPRVVPPISLVLATWSDSYIHGLTDFRHQGTADSSQRAQALQPWLETVTAATKRACHDALGYSDRITQLTGEWNQRLGRYRQGSALDLLVRALPGVPLLTPEGATDLIGRSPVAVRAAITQLLEAQILVLRPSSSPRNRVLEAPQVIQLMTYLERTLATPHGNTRNENPVRAVPHTDRYPAQTTASASEPPSKFSGQVLGEYLTFAFGA